MFLVLVLTLVYCFGDGVITAAFFGVSGRSGVAFTRRYQHESSLVFH